jgi:o-succinylbenzoate synthase
MTITARWTPIRARLHAARDATRSWPAREGLALVLSDGEFEGSAGIAPLPGLSPETLEAAAGALAAIRWHEVHPAANDPLSIAERLVPADLPSVRLGVEAALLDLAGRRNGVPVAALLTDQEPSPAAATAALITKLDGALDAARDAAAAGARAIKLKIGRERAAEREIETVFAIRRAVGDLIAIRADANGALAGPDDPRIAALADAGAEWIEDPFPIERLLACPPLPLPVAIDEDVARDPARALRALERGRAHAIVLKPALLGGLGRALALAEAAGERGARAVVSHAYDPPTTFAACAHLALALDRQEVHGLGPYEGLEAWKTEHGESIAVPAWIGRHRIVLPAGGGLG